jgi:hypothetical protein
MKLLFIARIIFFISMFFLGILLLTLPPLCKKEIAVQFPAGGLGKDADLPAVDAGTGDARLLRQYSPVSLPGR